MRRVTKSAKVALRKLYYWAGFRELELLISLRKEVMEAYMRLRTVLISLILSTVLLPGVFAQKTVNTFPHAIERSADAGRIIALLVLVPESGMPKELIDKAAAIGVFPKVTMESMYFTHLRQGYGVISARTESGWTMPAFYEFSGSSTGKLFAKTEISGVVLLFMTRDAVDRFEQGAVKLKGEKKAIAGPVGAITDEQRKELDSAQILAYSYFNGRLAGNAFGKGFLSSFLLNPDNKINMPLYGVKGREVLAGKKVDTASLPAGIPAYQEALTKYCGKQ